MPTAITATTEIVSRTVEGPIHRYTYRDAHAPRPPAGQCAAAARRQSRATASARWPGTATAISRSISPSPAWAAVCHTINPRLFPEQIVYIVNHAEDRYVFFDLTFVPLVEKLRPLCKAVKGWVAMTDRAHMPASLPDVLCYEELLADENDDARLAGARRAYGVVALLHLGHHRQPQGRALLASLDGAAFLCRGAAGRLNLSARDVILPVVPMFHVNAWGLPYACLLVGAKLVFPGAALDGKSLYELFEGERSPSAPACRPCGWRCCNSWRRASAASAR